MAAVVLFFAHTPVFALTLGTPAPEFRLPQINGTANFQLKHAHGKVLIVYFFSANCQTSHDNVKALGALLPKYPQQQLTAVAVSFDADRATALKAVNGLDNPFPIVWDGAQSSLDAYELSDQPAVYVVDQEGLVRSEQVGCLPFNIQSLQETVNALLNPATLN